MHIKRLDLDDWIRKLEDRGIREFQFKNLPDDLKYRGWIQKAKDLGLLESIKITNGRHTWKIVPCNMYRKTQNKRTDKEAEEQEEE